MESLYEKYKGQLMTFPEDMPVEELCDYKDSGRKIPVQRYDKATFDRLVEQAKAYAFRHIVYIEMVKRSK